MMFTVEIEQAKEGFLICPACRSTKFVIQSEGAENANMLIPSFDSYWPLSSIEFWEGGKSLMVECICGALWEDKLLGLRPLNDRAKQAILNFIKKGSF